jgi:hypothetical protein
VQAVQRLAAPKAPANSEVKLTISALATTPRPLQPTSVLDEP